MRNLAVSAVFGLVLLGTSAGVRAQGPSPAPESSPSPVNWTPLRSQPDQHALVIKEIGGQIWSISLNLAPGEPDRALSVTGNVYSPDSDVASFVHCEVRPDSKGTLEDPESIFDLTCKGTSPCADTALACARNPWCS